MPITTTRKRTDVKHRHPLYGTPVSDATVATVKAWQRSLSATR